MMFNRAFFCFAAPAALAAAALAAPASAQVPPGYEVVRIADSPLDESQSHINDAGQVVFVGRVGYDNETAEIYLYDPATETTQQLTDNDLWDGLPDINNDGVIVWSRGHEPPAIIADIMVRYPDGRVVQLTDDDEYNFGAAINNLGHIAWYRINYRGCDQVGTDVMLFDGQSIRKITDDDYSNQHVNINDDGWIVWTAFDFCPGGFNWDSRIMLYRDGVTEVLAGPDEYQRSGSTVDNLGRVAWSIGDRMGNRGSQLWTDGLVSDITDDGSVSSLGDNGWIAWYRWHDDIGVWQVWLLRDDGLYRVTNDPSQWHVEARLNLHGEMVWQGGPTQNRDVYLMRRAPLGDLNCDGAVDVFDVEPFILALFDPSRYLNDFPECDRTLADMNSDQTVDAFDIEGFIEQLFP